MGNIFKSILFAFVLPVASMNAAPLDERSVESTVILGGGVGSLTSAIYLGRAGITPLVIEGPLPGGLLTQSHSVQNWPGEMDIEGSALMERMRQQAEASGARFLNEEVVDVDFSKRPFMIVTRALDGSNKTHKIVAESCIIAMGSKPNFLGIPGEQNYWGKGVTNCATCDGSLYKNKIVGVVGGGDAAILEALYLSNIAREVHVFVRKDSLRANEETRVAILREKSNVKFLYNTTVQEVKGDGEKVTSVVLKTAAKAPRSFQLDGLFLAIGSTPNSGLFQKSLKLDNKGFISLQKDQQTSIDGIYAIGDIVDPAYKQAISAAGDGAKAALQVQQHLSGKAGKIAMKTQPQSEKGELATTQVVEIVSPEHLQRELAGIETPVIIDFYATWCGPCKRVSPLIESTAHHLVGKVKFLKVNVDKLNDLSVSYHIQAMPTVLLLDSSGNELERKVGLDPITTLLKQLETKY